MTSDIAKVFEAQTELIELCMKKILEQERKLGELSDSVEMIYQRAAREQASVGFRRDD